MTESANYKAKYDQLITKQEIDGAATKAFIASKIRPEAQDAIMSQIRNQFSVDNGQVVAMENGQIKTGADGNYSISEFVSSQPDFMRVPNDAGAANGATNTNGMMQGNNSRDRITSGLKNLMTN